MATQNSLGNASVNRNYAATDNTPLIGSSYYRLKINDNDGSYKYSDIKKATFNAKGFVSITPNPTSGSIIIKAPAGELRIITVINAAGSIIKQFSGNTTATQMPLYLSSLPKGIYMIKTESTSQKVVLK